LRIAVPRQAADTDPRQQLTCGKFSSDRWLPVSVVSWPTPHSAIVLNFK
jgi:hypothetical protein